VVFNLTVADAKSFGFITAYASGSARPNASNVNFSAGQIVPNSVTVPVGADGKVSLFNRSSGTVQLIADVSGYYLAGTASVPGAFKPAGPDRFLDTRSSAPVSADASVSFQVAGVGGLPANVSAVVFNLTVAEAKSFGFITAHASGSARPNASNVNFSAGQIVPNSVTVPVGADGKVSLFNRSSGTVQLIADVSGYYVAGTAPQNVPGAVWMWGSNGCGQLGNGSSADSTVPVQVTGLTAVKALYGEGRSNYSINADGTISAWGCNDSGQLGNGTKTNASVPVPVTGIGRAVAMATGFQTAYVLLEDGTVWSWGYNYYGQLGNGTSRNESTVPVKVAGLSSVKSIAAGGYTAYAVLTDGTVRAWGLNSDGGLGTGTASDSSVPVTVANLTGVASVSTSTWGRSGSAFAVLNDGSLRVWGNNEWGQLGIGTTTASSVPVVVPGLTGVTSVATSPGSLAPTTYALLSNGTVRAWGYNNHGQLGNGTTTDSTSPVQVQGISTAVQLAHSQGTGFARLADGTVKAWGHNDFGDLGNGSFGYSTTPVSVTGLSSVKQVAAGDCSQSAILGDGTVRSWGFSAALGTGDTSNRTTPGTVVGLKNTTALLPCG
jgi:alpha-tubulin suppressor-like RCC1 family protein